MAKYRRRSTVVEAAQWLPIGSGAHMIPIPPAPDYLLRERRQWPRFWRIGWELKTPAGWVRMPPRFWIIMGVAGEYYPCDPVIFNATYEKVDE